MTNFYTLTRTDLAEAAKEYKFIWLTLFFVILGVTQPLVHNYMDVILENVGGADGITIDPNRPVPSSESAPCLMGVTSADSATLYGARLPGAGISVTASSGRAEARRTESSARWNSAGTSVPIGISATFAD